MFDDAGETNLFEDEPTQKQAAQNNLESEFQKPIAEAKAASARLEAAQVSKRSKLSPEVRRERYDKLLDFVKPRLGRKPEVKLPQVRNSTWTNLVDLATTEDQLRELAQLFPAWSASGRKFEAHFSELFVREYVVLRHVATFDLHHQVGANNSRVLYLPSTCSAITQNII